MLRKLIGKIRRQPKQTRDNIALGIAGSFTFMVAAIWLFNIPGTFSGMLSVNNSPEQQSESFFDKISDQTAAVKDALTPDDSEKESLKELMDEYRAADSSSSTQSESADTSTTTASSTSRALRESFESFTTDSSYETNEPKEVRIQTISKSTTSTTTNE